MDIFDYFSENACSVQFSARTKDDCLRHFSGVIARLNEKFTEEQLFRAFSDREQQGSTAFENGIAIPHARLEDFDQFIIGIATSKKPVDFESLDGKKTNLFFVLVGPKDKPREFLRLLAQISLVGKNARARRELLAARTPVALKEIFFEHSPAGMQKKPAGHPKLLIIVLQELEHVDAVSELFLESGVRGATVLESTGMRGVLSNVPLFADFFNFLGDSHSSSKTIMTIIAESQLDPLVNGVEDIVGDLNTHAGAMMFTLDVSFMKGSFEMI